MAVITYPLNNIEYTAEDAETYFSTRTSGVYSAESNFALSISGSSSVSIGTGIAWVKDGNFSGKSIVSTESVLIDVPIADGVLNRKDRIVIQFDKAANATNIVLKQGTPATAAEAPSIVRDGTIYELGLYVIEVPAANISLNAGLITNTMLDENVCGLMRDGVTGIPTATLQAEAETIIAEIKDALDKTLAGSVPKHASTHAQGGSDEITPAMIGAATVADIPSTYAGSSSKGGAATSALACTGNSATATKLATGRGIHVDLASTSSVAFDGTKNVTPGVSGILSAANGGTGYSSLADKYGINDYRAITADAVYDLKQEIDGKNYAVAQTISNLTGTINVTVADNTLYMMADVTSLTLKNNENGAACHGVIEFASSTPSINVSGFAYSSGDNITSAKAGEIWEFSVFPVWTGSLNFVSAIIWKNWSA